MERMERLGRPARRRRRHPLCDMRECVPPYSGAPKRQIPPLSDFSRHARDLGLLLLEFAHLRVGGQQHHPHRQIQRLLCKN